MISVGDVVIVHDDSLPRSLWKLGLIEELFKGPDGVARGALVRLAPKDGKQSTLHRPIQRLYPLEVSQPTREGDLTLNEATEPSPDPDADDSRFDKPEPSQARSCPKIRRKKASLG